MNMKFKTNLSHSFKNRNDQYRKFEEVWRIVFAFRRKANLYSFLWDNYLSELIHLTYTFLST